MRNENLKTGERYARELVLISQTHYIGKNWQGNEKLIYRHVFTDGIFSYVYSGKNMRLTLGQKYHIRFTVKRQDTKYDITRMARLFLVKGIGNDSQEIFNLA